MCDGDCCKKADSDVKKDPTPYEVLMSQPAAVWIALAVGYVVATAIKK
jgi:hypothetical protein